MGNSVSSFKQFVADTESLFKAENEIIRDKLELGINGLEWLVLNTYIDSTKREMLNTFLELAENVYKKDPVALFKDAAVMKPDDFYEKHELNWWILFYDALTYLAILRQKNYDAYFYLLNAIYENNEKAIERS